MKTRCDVREFASCTGCGACRAVCAFDALRMVYDAEGFAYPRIDGDRCTDCGACRAACPVDQTEAAPWLLSYAARNTNEDVRGASSSGGVFTLFAEAVLGRGGIVFGAALFLEEDGPALRHVGVENATGLVALRGSKYLQSDLGDVFCEAKAALDAGREVLFSGTPCQVAGLYAVLKGPQANLLTVDLVCHGVPSPLVFSKYVRHLEAQHGQRVRALSFRDKRRGWKDFCLAATFADGSEHVAGQTEDMFMVAFLRNFCLRPSCHVCPFAGEKRQADLSLADLWGAHRLMPGKDDDRGLSLVLANSQGGKQALEAVQGQLWLEPVEADAFIRENPSILHPTQGHPRRAAFMRHLQKRGFNGLEKYFLPPGLLRRAANKVLRIPGGVLRRVKRHLCKH
ncbi:MAG: Coenzyme F420 hydrogenase/dehydrogenase, beta subunit C-terminal domain [Clostridia bacterium]|nr:Coenzyme F420 hydrogenase/dehydrogenase, beta subunit C-terminal domain [Clostridia bacterium]